MSLLSHADDIERSVSYQYTKVPEMMLRYESHSYLTRSLNGDEVGLESLGILVLDDIGFHLAITKKTLILNRAVEDFMESSNVPDPLHAF